MRYELLLAVRGLSAVWVLLCHSIDTQFTHLPWSSAIFKKLAYFMQQGAWGVSIFFLISGYGIAGSMQRHRGHATEFLVRRMKRVYPAYWASFFLIIAEVSLVTALGLQKHSAIPPLRDILVALPLIAIPQL